MSKSTFDQFADIFRPVDLAHSFDKLKTITPYVVTFDDRHSVLVNSYSIEVAEHKAKEWMQQRMLTWVKMVSSEVEEIL